MAGVAAGEVDEVGTEKAVGWPPISGMSIWRRCGCGGVGRLVVAAAPPHANRRKWDDVGPRTTKSVDVKPL